MEIAKPDTYLSSRTRYEGKKERTSMAQRERPRPLNQQSNVPGSQVQYNVRRRWESMVDRKGTNKISPRKQCAQGGTTAAFVSKKAQTAELETPSSGVHEYVAGHHMAKVQGVKDWMAEVKKKAIRGVPRSREHGTYFEQMQVVWNKEMTVLKSQSQWREHDKVRGMSVLSRQLLKQLRKAAELILTERKHIINENMW